MSYTEIFKINKDGKGEFIGETKNSFRGAMAIWSHLEKKYLPNEGQFNRFVMGKMNEVWDLAKGDRITEAEKRVMQSTFDNVLVKKENLPKLLEYFRNFETETSLSEQAEIIEEAIEKDNNLIAIGWNQTSVNGDNWSNWGGYDEETDEPIPYDINTMDKHWYLFSE